MTLAYVPAIWDQIPHLRPQILYAYFSGVYYPVISDSTGIIYLYTDSQIYGVVKSKTSIVMNNDVPVYVINSTDEDKRLKKAPLRPLLCSALKTPGVAGTEFIRLYRNAQGFP